MTHIHTLDGQHDFTVSAFIINPKTKTLLLHKHKLLGLWLQPGGHIELNETPWQALAHEILEETGYEIQNLDVLQTSFKIPGLVENEHPVPLVYRTHQFQAKNTHWHTDAAFAFITENLPTQQIGEGESTILSWMTIEEILELSSESIVQDTCTIGIHLLENFENLVRVSSSVFSKNI